MKRGGNKTDHSTQITRQKEEWDWTEGDNLSREIPSIPLSFFLSRPCVVRSSTALEKRLEESRSPFNNRGHCDRDKKERQHWIRY